MKKDDKASISLKKIVCVSIALIFLLGIGVMAGNVKVNNVKIVLSSGYEMDVVTTKTNVKEILDENHILLLEDEKVFPLETEDISDNKTIVITKEDEITLAQVEEVENSSETTTEDILQNYSKIIEKIVTEQVSIPYETITKDVSTGNGTKLNQVVQNGVDGIKEVTYKVKYQNDEQIEKIEISSKIIKEPVNKIVEVKTRQVTSRSSEERVAVSGTKAEYQAYAKERCYAYGWSESDFNCLVSLWNKESGWNVTAKNRNSGAYGIPQALPGSKMASAGSDYLTNYKTQIDWGLNYIKSRYGTPTAAWQHSQSKGWY